MTDDELTHQYVPSRALQALYRRAFERIQIEDGFAEQVRRLSDNSRVLYVLPNLNWVDFLALDYLTKRYGLPPIRYANDLGLWILNPKGPNISRGGLLNMLLPNRRTNPEAELRDAISHNGSAALFLKRPASVLDVASGASGGRGMKEGDALVRAILQMQREGEQDLVLLPVVFVWSKSPDKVGSGPLDFLLGSAAWPTPARTLGAFAYNMNHATLRFGEPIHLGRMLDESPDASDEVLVRRMTYMVLRRIERERRAVVGPAEKAAERVRSEIVRSPRLKTIINDLAGDNEKLKAEKTADADKMLKELQATPHPDVLKGMGMALDWGFHKIYRGIEFDPSDIERVRKASRDGALVLLPSHKSHIDYLVLSYFFYQRNLPMPAIAAGDNLNFQPVGPIFRRCGAFFIRRSFKGDRLYAAVVDAYIRRLIRDGFPIEVFLEGGRSRTGKLLEPKFGLLNMIVDGALGVPAQKVHFVPVSIGYERVVEADSYQREVSGAEKKKEEASDLLSASDVLRYRYGRINLQFGNILTLDEIQEDLGVTREQIARPAKRRALVTKLGNRVMDEINRVTAVTPGSLTALAILADGHRPMAEGEIIENAGRLLAVLRRLDARITTPTLLLDGSIRPQSIQEALQMFVDAELLEVASLTPTEPTAEAPEALNPIYKAVEGRRLQLDTSKNIIVHFFVERGLVASALDRGADGRFLPTPIPVVRQRVLWASRLFKHEFRFRADAPFEDIFKETCDALVSEGHLANGQGDTLEVGVGEAGWDGQRWLLVYGAIVQTFFEGYLVAAAAMTLLLSGARSEKDLIKSALSEGNQLYIQDRIARREAVSKPLLSNAFHAFVELGFLRTRGGKLELQQAFHSHASLTEIEAAISGYLSGRHEAKP